MNTNCPVCDGKVKLGTDLMVSEVIECSECHRKIVVKSLKNGKAILAEAPHVEEDWGE